MRYLLVVILVLFMGLALPLSSAAQETEGREIEGLELLEDYPAVQFWFEAYAGHYPVRINEGREFIASNAKQRETQGNVIRGWVGISGDMSFMQQLMPDLSFTIENVVAEGNFVVVRYTGHYTADKIITYPGMVMFQFEDNRLQEIWNYLDWCDAFPEECPE